MKRRAFLLAPALFPLVCMRSQQQGEADTAASQIWESMIDAKGGRDLLYNVETMVQEVHQHLSFRNPKFKDGDNHWVRAFAFPDREWDWSSAPVFGGRVHTANLAENFGYLGLSGNDIRKLSDDFGREKRFLQEAQLVYLNETRWLKPKPVRVLADKTIPKNIEAIETTLTGERVDFWINRENHLPVKIVMYYQSQYRAGLEPGYTYSLSDYQRMGGIQIPYQVLMSVVDNRQSTFRFTTTVNPKLREDLFTSPPRFEDGPEAWRPK